VKNGGHDDKGKLALLGFVMATEASFCFSVYNALNTFSKKNNNNNKKKVFPAASTMLWACLLQK